MSCSAWLNRGTLLGIGLGLLLGSGATIAWFRPRPLPSADETTQEAPKPEPPPASVTESSPAPTMTAAERTALIRKMEGRAEAFRANVEVLEKQAGLIENSKGLTVSSSSGGGLLPARLFQLNASDHRLTQEQAKLECLRGFLRAELNKNHPANEPDPVLVAGTVSKDERVRKAKAELSGKRELLARALDLGGNADEVAVSKLKSDIAGAQSAYEAAKKASSAEAIESARRSGGSPSRSRFCSSMCRSKPFKRNSKPCARSGTHSES